MPPDPAAASGQACRLPSFTSALPGYHYSFPKDHGAHEAYRTEWWYYTGHLKTAGGETYGYQLTFFRSGMDPPHLAANPSRWAIRHLYLAHFAITDENKKRFFYTERVSRAGIGNAGAETIPYHVWNGGWMARTVPSASDQGEVTVHHLVASGLEWAINLFLTPMKPPVIHGQNGISKKGEGPAQASHYYSLTRMETRGTLKINGRTLEVKGTSWMDHEFGSNRLSDDQVGWDWFGLQLDSGTEFMFYQIRRKDGGVEPYPSPSLAKPDAGLSFSSGTIILPDGRSRHLTLGYFHIKSNDRWQSPKSVGTYPSGWQITIPGQDITLTLVPTVSDQELITTRSTGVTYWEGSVRIKGTQKGRSVTGKGYVELTGYAEPLRKKF